MTLTMLSCKSLAHYMSGKIDIISSATENQKSRLTWETVNEITGRKNTPTDEIKADNSEVRLKKWKDHFENLLGQPPIINEQEVRIQEFFQVRPKFKTKCGKIYV